MTPRSSSAATIDERVRRSRRSWPTTTIRTSSAPPAGCYGCGTRTRLSDRYPNAQPLPARAASPARTTSATASRSWSTPTTARSASSSRDPDEPIIAAYARIFPGLFEPLSAMPEDLVAHLRYPEDLFTAQNEVYRALPPAGHRRRRHDLLQPGRPLGHPGGRVDRRRPPMEPYYVTMRIPGEDAGRVRPHPADGARGPAEHDRLGRRAHGSRLLRRAHRLPLPDRHVDPGAGADRGAHRPGRRDQRAVRCVERPARRSSAATCWCCRSATTGCSTSSRSSSRPRARPFPEFVRVIMVDQRRVAFAEDVEEGLRQLLGEAEPPPVEEPEPSPSPGESPGPEPSAPELPADVAALVAEPSACTTRRRPHWPTATSGPTRSGSTSSPRSSIAWPI